MKQSLIHTSWNNLSKTKFDHASDPFKCLASLQECFKFYNLGEPPEFSIDAKRTTAKLLSAASPSFKNLTEDILLELRLSIYENLDGSQISLWTEKLLRFCELRMTALKMRLREKTADQKGMRVFGLQWISLFLDEHFRTGDYRFLNTALKMQDLGWLYREKDLPKVLKAHPDHHPIPLFQFRILLNTEFALSRIRQHG